MDSKQQPAGRPLNIAGSIESLSNAHNVQVIRSGSSYSFGTFDDCKQLLKDVFVQVDTSLTKPFLWLPEYDHVAKWMSDTKGQGIACMGDCGRGKSTIVESVLPVLFLAKYNKVIRPVPARKLNEFKTVNSNKVFESVEYLLKSNINCIGELGVEKIETNYNEPYEPFNPIIDAAEEKIKLLILSTNLTIDQFGKRYGTRAIDRFQRLCYIVNFKGDSLR